MKKTACVSLSKETYHKVHVLHVIRNYFFGEKNFTISSMVEDAIIEYFSNHKDEIDAIIKKYREEGGCMHL